MSTFLHDIRYAARSMRRNWAFTTVAVVSLALAIGGNVAVFSMVEAFLFRPTPLPDAERLVLFGERQEDQPAQQGMRAISLPTWADVLERSRAIESGAALSFQTMALRGEERSEPITTLAVTEGYFDLLKVPLVRGRSFAAEEGVEGGPKVAVITEAFQDERFGDSSPLGEVLRLNGDPYEIVGVVDTEADLLFSGAELYVPLTRNPREAARDRRSYYAIGRMASGATMESVRSDLERISRQLIQEFPGTQKGWTFDVLNARNDIPTSQTKVLFGLLQGTVMLVLLIACVNVTNLLLARGQERSQEIALRAVLGASRGRIVRQLLTESLFLGTLGGLAGLALGRVGIGAIARSFASILPPSFTPAMNTTVVLFSVGIAVGAGILFGLMPALQTLKRDHASTLREGGARSGTGGSKKSLSKALVVGEIALSMIALGVGSLMVRSFLELRESNPGYDGSDVLTANFVVPSSRYPEEEDQLLLIDQVLERLQGMQGVQGAALASNLPQSFGSRQDSIQIAGRVGPNGEEVWQSMTVAASSDFLKVMGIDLVQGRFFQDSDRLDGAPVAAINRTLAERHFPDRSPLGETVTVNGEPREIVGVVGDVQQVVFASGAAATSGETVYLPAAQFPARARQIAVKSGMPLELLKTPLREALQPVDPDLTVPTVWTNEERLDQAFTGIRVFNVILGGFGAVALFMAGLGTYGVLAYSVSQRRHEIGIRMAVGAHPRAVVGMISRQGLWLGVLGLVLGLLATLPLARVVEGALTNLATVRHSTLVAIAGILMAVTVVASFLPAWRAARVDPVKTLREE